MKKRLTALERDAMLRLNVALEILTTETGHLRSRLQGIPYAYRDIGCLKQKILRIVVALNDTIPDDQMKHWVKMLGTATYQVGTRQINERNKQEKEYGLWISIDTLKTLMAGLHDKCMVCDLDRGQRRACPLRKAIDSIPNDTPDREDGDCQYYTIL